MRRYQPMRPALFAMAVDETIARAGRKRAILDVGQEAIRIAGETGLSESVVARTLLDAGQAAHVALKVPAFLASGRDVSAGHRARLAS